MVKIIFVCALLFSVGCVSYPRPYPENFDKEGKESNFLAASDINIVDEQFTPTMGSPLKVNLLYKDKKETESSPRTSVDIYLEKCEMTQGFWENPWSLLSVATLTIYPFGNWYLCKTKVTIKTAEDPSGKVLSSEIEYYNSIGFGSLFLGFVNPVILTEWKKREVIGLVKTYLSGR